MVTLVSVPSFLSVFRLFTFFGKPQSSLSPFLLVSLGLVLVPVSFSHTSKAHCATRQFCTGWCFIAVSYNSFLFAGSSQVTSLNTFVSFVEASTEKGELHATPESKKTLYAEGVRLAFTPTFRLKERLVLDDEAKVIL